MKVLLILMVAVALAQTRPEAGRMQDLDASDGPHHAPPVGIGQPNTTEVIPVVTTNSTTSSSPEDASGPKTVRNPDGSPSKGSDVKQNADSDFGTSKIESEDRSSGYRNSTNSTGMPEGNQTTTTELSTSLNSRKRSGFDIEQTADSDVGTSKDGSEDRSCGYRNSTSLEDMPEVNQTTTTDLSTSSDSRNTSGSDIKQTTDSDLGTSTVTTEDHSWGYGGPTSFERVSESNRSATTGSPTSSGAGSPGTLPTLWIVYIALSLCMFNVLAIGICIYIFRYNRRCSGRVATVLASYNKSTGRVTV